MSDFSIIRCVAPPAPTSRLPDTLAEAASARAIVASTPAVTPSASVDLSTDGEPPVRPLMEEASSTDQPILSEASAPKADHALQGWPKLTSDWRGDLLGEAPDLPLWSLVPQLRSWVTAIADGLGVNESMVLPEVLVLGGAALGTQIRVKAGATWTEPPILWSCTVAPPGSRKTPLGAYTRSIVVALERFNRDYTRSINEQREAERAICERAWQAYERERHEGGREGRAEPTPPQRPEDVAAASAEPRLLVQDVTPPSLIDAAAVSPRGLVAYVDEATAVFQAAGGSGLGRALWLQAYSGEPYTIDRVTRGVRHIERLAISVITGTQPDRVAGLIGSADDGLASRFLWIWPSKMPAWRISHTSVPTEEMVNVLTRISKLDPRKGMRILPITPDSEPILQKAIERWQEESERGGDLAAGWYAKAPGRALRIALILAAYRWGLDHESPDLAAVEAKDVTTAVMLIDRLFGPMMRRVTGALGESRAERMVARVVKHLVATKISTFNARSLRRENLGLFADKHAYDAALQELVDHCVIRRADRTPGKVGRRPGTYEVSPRLLAE
ncbi:DUF3987 domain-containing protein [Microvirga guangxiensis]|uniref:DUF3987 domain-containing protein n=1 Tax=Microvirga guangxiensis TaxID=549386 RepID=A0A1G5F410_9HYPH|nr:DUF3987 domain-containing protein [Microvirga guangxiensis]SCY33963.1 Protein of unknown function [Microvirga guangxiensis]